MRTNTELNIPDLRVLVYQSYAELRETGSQPDVLDFPSFLREEDFVYCTDEIEDSVFSGTTYLLGKVVRRENLSGNGNYSGLVVRTKPDGIEPFETHTGKTFRPMMLSEDGKTIIADLSTLEANAEKLEGYNAEEVISINFHIHRLLEAKHRELTPDEYEKFYTRTFAEKPIFF